MLSPSLLRLHMRRPFSVLRLCMWPFCRIAHVHGVAGAACSRRDGLGAFLQGASPHCAPECVHASCLASGPRCSAGVQCDGTCE
eukprot:363456-Chlamydomonas_euryale.AAC.1